MILLEIRESFATDVHRARVLQLEVKPGPFPELQFAGLLLTSATFPDRLLMKAELKRIRCKLYEIHLLLRAVVCSA